MLLIKSIFIGIFAIFPGISGSALAISLNLYDQIFYSLKDIKKNIRFLFIVIFGLIIGVIIGSNIIIYLSPIKIFIYFIFIGLILSDIPIMIGKIRNKGNIRFVPLLVSFLFSLVTLLFYNTLLSNEVSPIIMIMGGVLFSFGKIFPGVSSSFFLIMLGVYDKIIKCFGNPFILLTDFLYYFPFVLGCLLGVLIFVKIYNYLLIKHYELLYSVLIGLMLSSIISIFPKNNSIITTLIGLLLMMTSFIISFKLHLKKEI